MLIEFCGYRVKVLGLASDKSKGVNFWLVIKSLL